MIVPIVWTFFETTGTIGTMRTIISKPGFKPDGLLPQGQLFGTTKVEAEVDVCYHIPLGNWLIAFSNLKMSLKSVLDKNICMPK